MYKNLRCPICNSGMQIQVENGKNKTLFCNGVKRHAYDFSSSGYINFAPPSQSNAGDSKGAVRARTAFLDRGYYEPIATKICEILKEHFGTCGNIVDAGCGEGYYSQKIASEGFCVFGFDLSKSAVESAAKRAKRQSTINSFFGVATVFDLPLDDNSIDAVVNVFAPCVESEYSRILKDNGVVLVVHAGKEHLLGLKKMIYESAHVNQERADLPKNMELINTSELKYSITVEGNEHIKNLFAMTPYYWKTSKNDVEKLENVETLSTDIHILFSLYKKHFD